MKHTILFLFFLAPALAFTQVQTQAEIDQIESQPKPSYCDEPVMAATSAAPGGSPKPPMPQYPTLASVCYKVQVAILRETSPYNFAFHPSLTARWAPCEEVWVVETKETMCDKAQADEVKGRLKELGYADAYLTKTVGYQ